MTTSCRLPIHGSVVRVGEGPSPTAEIVFPPTGQPYHSHYPHRPVIPGISVMRAVGDAVRIITGNSRLALSHIERVRFSFPVRPGESIGVSVEELPATRAGDTRVRSIVRNADRKIAGLTGTYRAAPEVRIPGGVIDVAPSTADLLPHRRPMVLIADAEVGGPGAVGRTSMLPVDSDVEMARLFMLEAFAQTCCVMLTHPGLVAGTTPVIGSIAGIDWRTGDEVGGGGAPPRRHENAAPPWRHEVVGDAANGSRVGVHGTSHTDGGTAMVVGSLVVALTREEVTDRAS